MLLVLASPGFRPLSLRVCVRVLCSSGKTDQDLAAPPAVFYDKALLKLVNCCLVTADRLTDCLLALACLQLPWPRMSSQLELYFASTISESLTPPLPLYDDIGCRKHTFR
jgi:hypothetical protein